MSETKSCGNCRYFKDEDVEGWGCCSKFITQQHVKESECTWYVPKFVANLKPINGWTEITPDNEEEVYDTPPERLVIANIINGLVFYSSYNDMPMSIVTMAKHGGYFYYVLPELNIE